MVKKEKGEIRMASKDKKQLLSWIDELTKMPKFFILLYGEDELPDKIRIICRLWNNNFSVISFFKGCTHALMTGFEKKWFDFETSKEEEETDFKRMHAFAQEKFATIYGDETANKLVCVIDAVCVNLYSLATIIAKGIAKGMPKKEFHELIAFLVGELVIHLPKKEAIGFLKLVIDDIERNPNWDKYPKWKP